MRREINIDAHRAKSHVSIEAYIRTRQIELGQALDGRTAVYPDLNYWIRLRKAAAGAGTPSETALLKLMRDLARDRRIFCPISESVLVELLKQDDPESRLRTAELIDELSTGVAMTSFDIRAGTELAHLIHTYDRDPAGLHPLRHLVWLRPSYVFGGNPSIDTLDAETQLAMQKSFFDVMWSMSLADLIRDLGNAQLPNDNHFRDLAENLNAGAAENSADIRSYVQAYVAESRGAVSVFGETVMDIVRRTSIKHNRPFPAPGSEAWAKERKIWEDALFQVLQMDDLCTKLPSIHVQARLHAAFRWDKKRRFKGNDIYDFHHASAALGFCQAFLTERSLHAMITAKHTRLSQQYNCRVMADIGEAIEYLKGLPAIDG